VVKVLSVTLEDLIRFSADKCVERKPTDCNGPSELNCNRSSDTITSVTTCTHSVHKFDTRPFWVFQDPIDWPLGGLSIALLIHINNGCLVTGDSKMKKLSQNKTTQITGLLLGSIITMMAFQNCSPTQFSALSSPSLAAKNGCAGLNSAGSEGCQDVAPPTPTNEHPPVAASTPPPNVDQTQPGDPIADREQLVCKNKINGSSAIVFDTAQPGAQASAKFSAFAIGNIVLKAVRIDSVEDFAAGEVSATASIVGRIGNFAAARVSVNSGTVDQIENFAAAELDVTTHSINVVENFAAGVCISAQKIGSIQNLAGKVTLYGRSEGGVKATLTGHMRDLAAYLAVYDFDIPALENQAIHAKFVNSHIGSLSAAAGTILLVNSTIDDVSRFAGVIRLRGTSKVGSVSNASVQIIQE
jgi:hypothetical protein